MGTQSKHEYLQAIRPRYRSTSRKEKARILDEFCANCGYNRKYAIRILNSSKPINAAQNLSKRGRNKIYKEQLILTILTDIWKVTNLPCSKRLKAILPIWLPFYEKTQIPENIYNKLLNISATTIDRLMAKDRSKFGKMGLSTTKPGSLLKKHIPVKTGQWDEQNPGFLEADTVAHCGNSVAGMFVYSLNCVDIASGWTEQRACWGKGEKGVLEQIKSIESNLPFPIKGFDCDNGSEFLNWHLLKHLTQRKKPIDFSRSRPYQKNDNAHIENKNWTHIRQYLGYQRFEKKELVGLMNDLYQNEWNLYFNFFMPSVKLVSKIRVGSKTIKVHDKPKTPVQRLIESDQISDETKQALTVTLKSLNPFMMQKQMELKIKSIINIVNKKTFQ
jgi:hypothetical protein